MGDLKQKDKRERFRKDAVKIAVRAAEQAIMDSSGGSSEEARLLITRVTMELLNKVLNTSGPLSTLSETPLEPKDAPEHEVDLGRIEGLALEGLRHKFRARQKQWWLAQILREVIGNEAYEYRKDWDEGVP